MYRTWLAATAIAALMTGAASAQTTTSTTTTQTTAPVIVPIPAPVTETTTRRTVDENGVVTDHSRTITNGTAVSPYGDTTTTRRTTETTTIR